MKLDKKQLLLYAITDRSLTRNIHLSEAVELAILGGATFIQLREKNLSSEDIVLEAQEIKKICSKHNVPLIINDDVSAAISSDADGVHIGQQDMNVSLARHLIGDEKILGVSVQTKEQAISAEKCGADYLGVGAIFPTVSKPDADSVTLDTLKEICDAVTIPVVAIGGICAENIPLLSGTGISGIAVISAIFAADDIKSQSEKLKCIVSKAVE